ncbi:MAG: HEPN domain-containing protein [Acidobacteria bacterium]|nr:HEPN domain-containing protein [Acidobacteriota bacterium]
MSAAKSDHAAWLAKAEDDMLVIGSILAAPRVSWEAVAFHAQQAAEKFLKGFLAGKGTQPPKTHDLVVLLEIASEHDAGLGQFQVHARKLNSVYISSRYPSTPSPTEGEARECMEIARQVRAAVLKHFP